MVSRFLFSVNAFVGIFILVFRNRSPSSRIFQTSWLKDLPAVPVKSKARLVRTVLTRANLSMALGNKEASGGFPSGNSLSLALGGGGHRDVNSVKPREDCGADRTVSTLSLHPWCVDDTSRRAFQLSYFFNPLQARIL